MKSDQQDWYRLHYCGTCKSIGRMYGQRSRMLLNFDCVFLAELLSVLQQADTEQWDDKLSSHSCFALPEEASIPLSLQYAADMNLILAEMKMRDNLQDDGVKFIWKSAQRFFKKPFYKIQDRLAAWNIDVQVLLNHQADDSQRETQSLATGDISSLLTYHAAPSATITGYLFSKGAEAVQKPAWKETMYKIGAAFGELVYGLDAWKDVEDDEEMEDFNLLLLHPEQSLEASKKTTVDWLWEKAETIQDIIRKAPFPADVKASLTSRLMLNLASSLGESSHVCTPQSGIEKASVPTMSRTINTVVGTWANPLKPARFAASYIALLLVIFHQQLFAAANYGEETSLSFDWGLLTALIAAPVGMYFAARSITKNRDGLLKRLKSQQKKIEKRIHRAKKKAAKKDSPVPVGIWVLIGVLSVILILLIVLVVLLGSCLNECNDCDCNC